MLPFKPNEKYARITKYACGVSAVAIAGVTFFLRFGKVWAVLSDVFSLLSPLLWGVLFSFLTLPVVRLFEKLFTKKQKTCTPFLRMLAIFTVYLILFSCFYLYVRFIIPLLIGDGERLGVNFLAFGKKLFSNLSDLGQTYGIDFSLETMISGIQNYFSEIIGKATSFGASVVTLTYRFGLGLILSFSLLFYRHKILTFSKKCIAAFCSVRVSLFIKDLAKYANQIFGQYLVGKILNAFILFAVNTAVFSVLKIPYAILIANVMALFSLIPAIGPLIGSILCSLLICTESPIQTIWFLIAALVIHQLNNALLAPKILGSAVGLNGVWIMVSISLFGGLFGPLGMFLSVPLFSVLWMLLGKAANRKLQKNRMPTDAEKYSKMFSSCQHIIEQPRKIGRFRYVQTDENKELIEEVTERNTPLPSPASAREEESGDGIPPGSST
ncbi:MAG: AI-2E family transporter [Clostridia bacterium]|nr:AI-2E family transporter [Clostridia bacterium]